MFRFLATGHWLPSQVHCDWTDVAFAPEGPLADLIDRAWAAAQRPGLCLFDGPMCRLDRFEAAPDRLRLNLSRTSYKVFLGTNLHNAASVPADQRANPVGLSCALTSSEGHLLMGRRNQRVAYYPGRVHPFAGSLEPHQPIDVFRDMRRELNEELGLSYAEIGPMACLGIAEDLSLRQPELIFLARCTLAVDALRKRVRPTEHDALWSISPSEGRAPAPPELTPIARATLSLWFDQQPATSP